MRSGGAAIRSRAGGSACTRYSNRSRNSSSDRCAAAANRARGRPPADNDCKLIRHFRLLISADFLWNNHVNL